MLSACSKGAPSTLPDKILFDFETEEELNRLFWKCHVVYSLSGHHASHGKHALKIELYPSPYPGVSFPLDFHDWRAYKALCFEMVNPYDSEKVFTLRIDDMKVANDYADRVNRKICLSPGMNRVRISFETLETSGTRRFLNLKTIERFLLFQADLQEKSVFYIDSVRLVTDQIP